MIKINKIGKENDNYASTLDKITEITKSKSFSIF